MANVAESKDKAKDKVGWRTDIGHQPTKIELAVKNDVEVLDMIHQSNRWIDNLDGR